ncbi:MAG TPA: dockerin type I repeat-containing protein [Planctomycetota bacterium]|jgi:hypothetical protein|nr:dockerin type I repeat-containing protein [Planctomycetota bacterium]OQC21624.1 MAG: hypothetical protein BWX69_00838 [Planctomycetes bacterium ADurb.Bin069]HNR98510.1 dockerin type I repeat-containing protein [Planctomycetota bacterium]HNU26204.1 dockerin type I repeat-containing protein [Planctomycetota bacterium]HOE28734.1 dockerin type I repeat-containing protein [Planctomycetota bacterium]
MIGHGRKIATAAALVIAGVLAAQTPPVTLETCAFSDTGMAHIAWSNGSDEYTGIHIGIDGIPAPDSPLPGAATSYDSARLEPGHHTFTVQPFIDDAPAEPQSCAAEALLPPPYDAACEAAEDAWRVQLAWSNAFAYESVKIARNGAEIAALPGDAVEFVDTAPGPGAYLYLIHGTLGPQASEALACAAEIAFVPPAAITLCAAGEDRRLQAAWENGAGSYDGIEVRIDGAAAPDSPLPGDATAYDTAPLDPGAHTLTLIPFIGAFQAQAALCQQTAALPAPESLACAPSNESWEIALTWTAAWPYESITVTRDGLPVATLTGAPESYLDRVPGPGTYAYELRASLGTLDSEAVDCVAAVSVVPPVSISGCSCNAQRVARVAWTNAVPAYDGIEIIIDGEPAAASPLPGDAASYASPPLAPGPHTIGVRPFAGAVYARAAECLVAAPLTPPVDMVCRARSTAPIVDLTWTNTWTYDSVTIFRNGQPAATLSGSATAYADEVPGPGTYAYFAAGVFGNYKADSSGCVLRVTFVPPPRNLTCAPAGMRVQLAWSNPMVYDEIGVLRDGAVLAVLPGSAASFDDTLADLGSHDYAVAGVFGRQTSAPAVCTARATDVLFVRGDVNADGIVDVADVIAFLNYLFRGGRRPPCMEAANLNDDGAANLADIIYALAYTFRDGPAPKAPFPGCGPDPSGGSLGCLSFPPCAK